MVRAGMIGGRGNNHRLPLQLSETMNLYSLGSLTSHSLIRVY